MTTPLSDIDRGREVVRIEAEAVAALEQRIGGSFTKAVEILFACQGRVIITGMGKSGIVARKIVATMNSTGTPALFLHPSDAIHGDLGMVRNDDVVICISKSGDTQEILQLIPMFKRIGVPIISMIGNGQSRLGDQSDVILDISVEREACENLLAPTASTTVTLVLGDALAITLLQKKEFGHEEFAMFHPGGNLGKRLLLKVEELMASGKQVPVVKLSTGLKETILEMTTKRLGATCVVDDASVLCGIVTDGDLRRFLQKATDVFGATAADIMTRNPKTIRSGMLAAKALQEMEAFNITQLIIVDEHHHPVGMVHLHELVKAGLGGESIGHAL